MRYKQTVIFYGAGASVSYGLPCGNKFVEDICEEVLTETELKKYLINDVGISQNDLKYFGNTFIDARYSTIDEFLETRKDLKELARYIVGAKLISHENPKKIREKRNDWLSSYLITLLNGIDNYNDASPVLGKVNFYTLNYDRSVEHILFSMLQARYCRSNVTIEQLLSSANRVQHVHGSLGQLALIENENGRPYDMNFPDPGIFKSICKNLKFWDDGSNKHYDNRYLNVFLENAERIIFLGFGFHPGILTRFEPDILRGKEIFCTIYGINKRRWEEMIQFLAPDAAIYGIPPIGTKKVGNVYFEETCEELKNKTNI